MNIKTKKMLLDGTSDKKVRKQVEQFESKYEPLFPKNPHKTIFRLRELINEANTGKVVRLLCYIKSIAQPEPHVFISDEEEERFSITHLVFSDIDGYELNSNVLYYPEYEHFLNKVRGVNGFVICEGTLLSEIIVSVFGDVSSQYMFYLSQIKTKITPLDLIAERDYSIEELQLKVEYHSQHEDGVRGFIKQEIINHYNIVALGELKELSKAIDFMILQALSYGMSNDGRYSNKLHSLIVGPPASGKKLLTLIAKLLNPVSYEVASTPGKLTPAGLVGKVKVKGHGETTSEPGYLPMANNGLVAIQDFHELTSSRNIHDIFDIMSKVMEDGEVIDSTSAKTTHVAITSLHIDMNRMSEVYNNKKMVGLGIPKNVLSRFDFIIEISADYDRQLNVLNAIAQNERELISAEHNYHIPEWAKTLRRMVAYMATYHNKIKVPDESSKYLAEKLDSVLRANLEYQTDDLANELVSTRIPISLKKLAKAICCSKLKKEVDTTDIDEAFSFLEYKLKFIMESAGQSFKGVSSHYKKDRMNILVGELKQLENGFVFDDYFQMAKDLGYTGKERALREDIKVLKENGRIKKVDGKYYII